jgi:hypothetical protein
MSLCVASLDHFSTHTRWLGGGGGGRGLVIGWPGIKRSCSHMVGVGGGTIQDIQEHNLNQFYQQI